MINKIFEKLISDMLEEHEKKINTSLELLMSEKKREKIINGIERCLKQKHTHLIFDLEEQQITSNRIAFLHFYRVGIYDGAELSRNISGIGAGSDFSFKKTNCCDGALVVYNEFNKEKGKNKECDSELFELITFIYEKAYQSGLFDGKHNVFN